MKLRFPLSKNYIVIALTVALCQLGTVQYTHAESTGAQAGTGIAAFFTTLIYTPTKMVYALVGGIVGSGAYALSGGDNVVACRIWTPSIRGTYVLSPRHLTGELPIRFAGLPPENERELDAITKRNGSEQSAPAAP